MSMKNVGLLASLTMTDHVSLNLHLHLLCLQIRSTRHVISPVSSLHGPFRQHAFSAILFDDFETKPERKNNKKLDFLDL